MPSMLVRNIPEDVLEAFQRRAKAAGKSSEQFAREAILERAAMTVEEAWAKIDAQRATMPPLTVNEWEAIWTEGQLERDEDAVSDNGANDH